jgi:catechol 2,3-dioxygenase-like lactoylglutathione lyase family enzyme
VKVRWTFHATAMVHDYEAALRPFVELFGARVLHDNVIEDEGIGRRGGMTWIGDGAFEIGEPVGDASPVSAFLERFGGGMHSVGMQIDDARAAKAHFAAVSTRIVSEPYPGLLFTHPRDTAGVLFEWNAAPQADDPRWGAPEPARVPCAIPIEQLAFLTVAVEEPLRAAARLADVLGTKVTFVRPDALDGIEAGVSLVDGTLALLPLDVAGVDRPRAHGIGLLVSDLDEALASFANAGRFAERLGSHLAVARPPAVPVPVFLCDELLPGDPRAEQR